MTDVKPDPVSPGQPATDPAAPGVKPGEKTDPALLLQSLQEEREKRRIAEENLGKKEAEFNQLQEALASGEELSPEGKALKTEIEGLKGQVAVLTSERTLSELQAKFPALKDKASEFKEFRKKYPEGNDESVAKIFLAENDLLGATPAVKGLERPSGGGHNPPQQGMTYAEAEELRQTNFRQYSKMLKEGKLNDLRE